MKQRTFRVNLTEYPDMLFSEHDYVVIYRSTPSGWWEVNMVTSPPGNKLVYWKPEPSWISKRRFVLDVLPDARIVRDLFGKLEVVSTSFSDNTGGMSLTGCRYEDLKKIWTRAYNQLTHTSHRNATIRWLIRQARANMVEREEGRGKK